MRDESNSPDALRNFTEVAGFDGKTVADDVAWELQQLRSRGIQEVVVVDLTKPEFQIPVVRVVIPGLEGMNQSPAYHPGERAMARFTSGR